MPESSIHEQINRLESICNQFDEIHEKLRQRYRPAMRDKVDEPETQVSPIAPPQSKIGAMLMELTDRVDKFSRQVEEIADLSDL